MQGGHIIKEWILKTNWVSEVTPQNIPRVHDGVGWLPRRSFLLHLLEQVWLGGEYSTGCKEFCKFPTWHIAHVVLSLPSYSGGAATVKSTFRDATLAYDFGRGSQLR
jgi:hypothetical protein